MSYSQQILFKQQIMITSINLFENVVSDLDKIQQRFAIRIFAHLRVLVAILILILILIIHSIDMYNYLFPTICYIF